ncbi:MAG: glycerophosphodiester phosphodiesterase [Candidatus Binatia bacterium]
MTAPPRFHRIAHRGASGHCPENTRSSFLRAIELGASMVELDCQMTRDGAMVVIHDETLDRTTSGRGRVIDRTLKEIQALDAGSWFSPRFAGEEVPTLEDVIAILHGKVSLNLEIKGDDQPGRLEIQCVGTLASLRFFADTVFSSFSQRRMRKLRELSGEARIAILMDRGSSWAAGFELAAELEAEAVHPERSLVRPELVVAAHDRGLEVRVWPVNDVRQMESLIGMGVDGIFTDYPDRLLGVTARRRAQGGIRQP